ncbi:MAG: uncharacterized protein JWN03_5757 [Nocardia sp.]|uniref:nucleotidyl transferase AbiEii/AbiGii toxin family protein n=1 Tax=Nocardia sp. TaxID=1821 RepID=UPI00260EC594|nr:nucleotidyl transferase AbiEii/AbiGii toxin family protein [Nocardia sp.]MCU1645482.1 uncharacterized protein [Nocardia sp.]
MLTDHDEQAVANQFGVARAQVHRDHLISHVLGAISKHFADSILFFGGTALSRTVLPAGRLSEDIDLIALGNRRTTAQTLEHVVAKELRREYPGLRWLPSLTNVRDTEPAVLTTLDNISVRIQLLNSTGYPPWPTEHRTIVQRYSDAPPAQLLVPTPAAFSAWKTAAWAGRSASRDLFDLKLLADAGAIDTEAAELFRRYGPTNRYPSATLFTVAPDEQKWQRELAAQTRLEISAAEALRVVREAWTNV